MLFCVFSKSQIFNFFTGKRAFQSQLAAKNSYLLKMSCSIVVSNSLLDLIKLNKYKIAVIWNVQIMIFFRLWTCENESFIFLAIPKTLLIIKESKNRIVCKFFYEFLLLNVRLSITWFQYISTKFGSILIFFISSRLIFCDSKKTPKFECDASIDFNSFIDHSIYLCEYQITVTAIRNRVICNMWMDFQFFINQGSASHIHRSGNITPDNDI